MQISKLTSMCAKALGLIMLLISFNISFIPTAFAENNYVHDEANVLSPAMKGKLEQLLAELNNHKNLLIEEVILPTTGSQEPTTIQADLMQKLDSRTSKAENRALILFVLDNGTINIYPNEKLSAVLDPTSLNNISQNAAKKMDEKNYDEMARVSIAGVYHYFQKGVKGDTKEASNKKPLYNMLFALVALIVIVGLIKFNNRKSS